MNHYGVRGLIIINSGSYEYANLDLSRPIHLVAPNNRGKSTLVNALQFLYVDDIEKMSFGKRAVEDTRRHYFGRECSYLIFECATPSGIQCLLVRGLSDLRSGQFERYVYDQEFRLKDFTDTDGSVIGFDVLRTRLADRHLSQIHHNRLWEVLAGQISKDGSLPSLNILPLRKLEEYRAFRDVFVRLLSLKDVDAAALRGLIIACHAREIGEQRIDIATEYKDEFNRAERSEQDLSFVKATGDIIDRGQRLREEVGIITTRLNKTGPGLWRFGRTLTRVDPTRSEWSWRQRGIFEGPTR
jgi:YD repeat-containing protein